MQPSAALSRLCELRSLRLLQGEHGTGRNVAPYVEMEWGTKAYNLMWQLKELFDPSYVLNPGVILNRVRYCWHNAISVGNCSRSQDRLRGMGVLEHGKTIVREHRISPLSTYGLVLNNAGLTGMLGGGWACLA